jgi:exosome complex component CSL4
MSKQDHRPILPGEHVASIEEFEGGKGTFLAKDGTVRSETVGTKVYDLKRRVVKVEPKNPPMLPKVGDIIVGYTEMLFSSMVAIKVLYINDKKSDAGFGAIASARIGTRADVERRGDRRATFHYGDIVRGRVISLLNSNIHLTLAEKEYGLLYAQCFMCGGDTVRTNESTIKCVDCGAFENRKLAHDYGKESVRLVYKAGK